MFDDRSNRWSTTGRQRLNPKLFTTSVNYYAVQGVANCKISSKLWSSNNLDITHQLISAELCRRSLPGARSIREVDTFFTQNIENDRIGDPKFSILLLPAGEINFFEIPSLLFLKIPTAQPYPTCTPRTKKFFFSDQTL